MFAIGEMSALVLPRAKVGVPYTDFKHDASQYILSTWQDDWNGAVSNKLRPVMLVLGNRQERLHFLSYLHM